MHDVTVLLPLLLILFICPDFSIAFSLFRTFSSTTDIQLTLYYMLESLLCVCPYATIFVFCLVSFKNISQGMVTTIFSNHFIFVRVTVDPEPIPGTLGRRQKYTPGWYTSQSQGTMHTNIHTLHHTKGHLELPVHLQACFCQLKGNQRLYRKPTRTSWGT